MSASFAALPPALRAALAAGNVVVTPNKRLARRLIALYDEAQRAAQRRVWTGAVAMPWEAWLRTLWQDAIAAGGGNVALRLLPPAACAYLWQRVVTADALPLLDRSGAAQLAADAWSLMHAWGSGTQSWRAWRDDASTEDTAAFARWAETYRSELVRRGCIDGALVGDALADVAQSIYDWRGREVLLAGFNETTPQQQRLLDALVRAGARVAHASSLPESDRVATRVHPATPREEITAALTWAASQVQSQPDARVAVVVEGLASRREEVLALAHEILDPGAVLPGARDDARPFDISLGQPLAALPLAAAALGLIALGTSAAPMGEVAALLRSVYLPAGAQGFETAWANRARIERRWLKAGCKTIDFDTAVNALRDIDGDLARRWLEARRQAPLPSVATPREWVDCWRVWLDRCGWPGARALDSAEWQARQAWENVLTAFAGLAAVEARLHRDAAWQTLRRMAQETMFQPESAPAPIAILGVLEAAGLPFDALWVAGLTAERWPTAPAPNPLLPLAWQRERGVPRSSASRELAYAETLTVLLQRGAPRVVMSSACRAGDAPLLPSALLLPLPEGVALPTQPTYAARIAATGMLEAIEDDTIPALAAGSDARGGAYLVGQYADCPFQAVASARLAADPWPTPLEGLSAMERGTLIHAALAHFWRGTRDQATLLQCAPDVLQARIEAAALGARAALPRPRWQELPPAVAAGESARLAAALAAWLERERERPSFVVQSIEEEIGLDIAGIRLSMRLDRVDTLADGGIAIIDYKGGSAERPNRWFDADRPRAPQLGLYAMARRAATPAMAVRAVAYVQLRPDSIGAIGLAADPAAWPDLTAVDKIATTAAGSDEGASPTRGSTFANWPAVEAWWDAHLGAVVAKYAAGQAAVAPRDRRTCERCGRQLLCRIGHPSGVVENGAHDA